MIKKIKKLNTLTLFTSAGLDEYFLEEINIDVVVANELLDDRAGLYKNLYPKSSMIVGDVSNRKIYNNLLETCKKKKVDLVIATPPCQGVSLIGKNKSKNQMSKDYRNHLIFRVIEIVKDIKPKYILIENVPRFLSLELNYNGKKTKVLEILNCEFKNKYLVESKILNTKDYGVPQNRKRAVIKIYKKDKKWDWPQKEKEITVRDAIGHLPSIEAGMSSKIKWHYARKHTKNNIMWMMHTPEGKSAFSNTKNFPQKDSGQRIKGFSACYSRMSWDKPSPTITMRNDCIASQRNVHPGRRLKNKMYSDARVLTPLELFILSSLPKNNNIPLNTPELLIRRCVGECVPPLFMKKICQEIEI